MPVIHALDESNFKVLLECRKFADAYMNEPDRSKHLRQVLNRYEYGGYIIDQETVDAMGLKEEAAKKPPPPKPSRTETPSRPAAPPAPVAPPPTPTVVEQDDYCVINGKVCARDGAGLKAKPKPRARQPETTPVPPRSRQRAASGKAAAFACQRLLDAARHRPDFPAEGYDTKTAAYAIYDAAIGVEYQKQRGQTHAQ